MKTIKKNQIILKNGKTFYCIQFNSIRKNINIQKFIDFGNSPGWIVNQNKIQEWYFSGITYINENSYIYGPNFDGNSLEEILTYPIAKALPYFEKLINSLEKLNKEINISFDLQLDNIYFLKNGDLLFLPPKVFEKIKDIDINYDFKKHQLINNPYLNKYSEKNSYSILILIYRLLTGKFPFESNSEEEILNKIRILNVIPPKLLNPEIKKKISDHISSLFKNNKYTDLSLLDWQKFFKKISNENIIEKISDKEKENYLEKYEKQKETLNNNFKKKIFWEKNNKRILAITIISIILCTSLFYYIKNLNKPRVIKDFPPEKVVETFYLSINKLDHLTMEECVINKAGKSDIDTVLSLYLNHKQSLAYTKESMIAFADEWDKKGRPIINPPSFIFGILNLNIKQESFDLEPVFIVNYEKWLPDINQNEINEKRIQNKRYKIKDKLFLKKHKNYWLIYKLDRIEKNEIIEE